MFPQAIGGGCDGCELMYIGMPEQINPTDTSAGWHIKDGHKLLITGSNPGKIVFKTLLRRLKRFNCVSTNTCNVNISNIQHPFFPICGKREAKTKVRPTNNSHKHKT